jgi:hypothetical protein
VSPSRIQKPHTEPAPRWGVGRVIPAVLAGLAVLTVLSGFLPLKWFPYADYEIARQVRQLDAPFMPNLHMRTRFFEGAEAVMANVRPTEPLSWRNFSTDRFGFRDTPPVCAGAPPRVVVFRGFSFVFGVGLGDEETFPAQLSRRLGQNVYNAARFHEDPETPDDFDRLMSKLETRPETVVYVHLEEDEIGLSAAALRQQPLRRVLRFARDFPLTWIRISPAIQTARGAKRALENDIVLHNGFRDFASFFPLPDGTNLLVRHGYVERAAKDFDESIVADRAGYIAWWNARIAERGARMVVLLVPARMSVYGPALGLEVPEDPYLNRMERYLLARGVRVVNGLTTLRETAAADLASGRLAYFREDEHWNAEGVRRLAAATAAEISMPAPVAIESSKSR